MIILDTIWTRQKKLSDERLSICGQCEYLEHKRMKCTKCGCYMEFKSLLPGAECPIGKWSKKVRKMVDMVPKT